MPHCSSKQTSALSTRAVLTLALSCASFFDTTRGASVARHRSAASRHANEARARARHEARARGDARRVHAERLPAAFALFPDFFAAGSLEKVRREKEKKVLRVVQIKLHRRLCSTSFNTEAFRPRALD